MNQIKEMRSEKLYQVERNVFIVNPKVGFYPMVFEEEQKAVDFCNNYSDSKTKYNIFKTKIITWENDEISVKK